MSSNALALSADKSADAQRLPLSSTAAAAAAAAKVLDEESYLSALETIIQRDFFPHLTKLRAQHEYLLALERKDTRMLTEIASRYTQTLGSTVRGGQTAQSTAVAARGAAGSFLETPVVSGSGGAGGGAGARRGARPTGGETPLLTPRHAQGSRPPAPDATPLRDDPGHGRVDESAAAVKRRRAEMEDAPLRGTDEGGTTQALLPEDKPIEQMSLDEFLAKHTSEDNASFDEIMEKARKRQRAKYEWAFKMEQQAESALRKSLPLALTNSCGSGALPMLTGPSAESGLPAPAHASEAGALSALPSLSPATSAVTVPEPLEKPGTMALWRYTPRSSLMYYPEGEPQPSSVPTSRVVLFENTRLDEDFLASLAKSATKHDEQDMRTPGGGAGLHPELQTKDRPIGASSIGGLPPGFEPNRTPRVGGFSFIATPTPVPGVDATPPMTWGVIDGSPVRLEDDEAEAAAALSSVDNIEAILGLSGAGVYDGGPMFKIANPTPRESLAQSLAEKASKSMSAKASSSTPRTLAPSLTPTPARGPSVFAVPRTPVSARGSGGKTPMPGAGGTTPVTPAERFSKLSAAAQKLALNAGAGSGSLFRSPAASPSAGRGGKSALASPSFGVDPALRASYSSPLAPGLKAKTSSRGV